MLEKSHVRELVAAGRAAWPELTVNSGELARFLAARVSAGTPPADVPIADLTLACACAGGDPRALAALERTTFGEVDAICALMRAPVGTADEIKQILRTRFFLGGDGRTPAIAAFAGRGDLRGWVRISAARELLRLAGRAQRTIPLEDAILDEIARGSDPETALVKRSCRVALTAVVREALSALPPRARTLLRYQVIDGLGITAIGAIYRVHRATAARWLTSVREALLADIQHRLGARLELDPRDVDSVLRLVSSQLDLSVVSAL